MNNPNIRHIFIMGGSSSAKTYSVAQGIINDTLENQNNHLCMRKFSIDLADTLYNDYETIGKSINRFTNNFEYTINRIKIGNAKIRFRGLDKAIRIQGISSYKRVNWDEINHFFFEDFSQLRKRLRGIEGQQTISTWNPISINHWINKNVIALEEWDDLPLFIKGNEHSQLYDKGTIQENSYKRINKAGNMLLIKTTYRDNWWIVGHPAGKKYGFYDKHVIADYEHDRTHNPNDYDVYANGNWGVLTDRLAFKPSEWDIIDEIPAGAKQIPSGLDFGWNPDPTALTNYYIKGNYLIHDEIIYDRKLINVNQFNEKGENVGGESIESRLKDIKFPKNQLIIAESAEPKSIFQIRNAGYNIRAVKKPRIIESMKLLKGYHHLITKRSKNIVYEFENYIKMIDKDGIILNEYIDKDNHSIDQCRYVQYMKGRLW